ncbi:MAG: DNA polymerase III subunit chi [Legionellaceae bacterium]
MSQTRADFYLLNDENVDKSLHFACRLLEKAYLSGHRIFVRCEDEEQAMLLDDRLWTFSATSFIPHHRVMTHELKLADIPIEISTAEPSKTSSDILFIISCILFAIL